MSYVTSHFFSVFAVLTTYLVFTHVVLLNMVHEHMLLQVQINQSINKSISTVQGEATVFVDFMNIGEY